MSPRAALALILLLVLAVTGRADPPESRRILHLLQYVAKDYPGAFASGEKDELEEQVGFLTEARAQIREMPDRAERAGIATAIGEALAQVEKKAPPAQVAALISKIVEDVSRVYPMPLRPPTSVSWSRGKDLYAKACASCHGLDGKAAVAVAETMDPKPAKFVNPEVMAALSPVRAYDTITYGVNKTPMPSFGEVFAPQDRWDLAFYVFTLRPDKEDAAAVPARVPPLAKLAALTDVQLEDLLKGQGVPAAQVAGARAAVRATVTYKTVEPGGIDRARAHLATAREEAKAGDRTAATHAALDAYLNGFESVEPFLKVVDVKLMQQIELDMQRLPRSLRADAPLPEIEAQIDALLALLDRAEAAIDREKEDARWFPFTASFLIMVREGVEAILVLAMLVAVLGKIGCHDQVKLVYRGTLGALGAGFLLWLGAGAAFALAVAQREALEGLVTLLAAALLYWAGLWMLSRLESRKWMELIKNQLHGSISAGSRGGVVLLSFLAVFREVVETILFYQALLAQYPNGHAGIFEGAAAGVLVLFVVAYLIFALGLKLPLSAFFGVSSAGMLILSVVMVGQAFVEIGAAGWLMPGSYGPVDTLGGPAGLARALQVAMIGGFCLALLPLLRPAPNAGAAERSP